MQDFNQSMYRFQPNNFMPQPQYNFMSGIAGRTVNDASEITVNDVPMDGRSAYFPKSDMSEIIVKNWAADGTIRTMTYKPIVVQNPSDNIAEQEKSNTEPFDAFLGVFEERMKQLSDKIDKLAKPSKSKKEVDDE